MERLKKIENVVERILDARKDARENDDVLYLYVCEELRKGVSTLTVEEFFNARKEMRCPPFASVVRARRKIFERRPELKPARITQLRADMEDVYVNYALNA